MAGLPDGTPIVCRQCGGGMSLLQDLSVHCPYCGARDALPHDELGRALEIKNRLALAEQRAAQVRGVDAALATIFEDRKAFLRVSGLYAIVALLVLCFASAQLVSALGPHWDRLSGAVVLSVVVGTAMGPLFVLCIAASFAIALARGRAHYRKRIRPLLLARLPVSPGAAFACRACGGGLPQAQRVDVRCTYCHAINLIPKELHGAHAAALQEQAEAARQQLRGVNVATISIARSMRVTLVLCAILTVLVAYGLPTVAQAIGSSRGLR
jgi:hypothetical protein